MGLGPRSLESLTNLLTMDFTAVVSMLEAKVTTMTCWITQDTAHGICAKLAWMNWLTK